MECCASLRRCCLSHTARAADSRSWMNATVGGKKGPKSKIWPDSPGKRASFHILAALPSTGRFLPMRRASALPKPPAGQALAQTHVWLTLRTLFPYLWRYRLRVLAAIGCLVAAKVANVGVPMIFKEMIDGLSGSQQVLALPILLLVLYGLLRFSTSLFTELREILFARVTQRAVPPGVAGGVPPSPCAVAALSSRTPDRRRVARHRAGQSLDLQPDFLHAVFDPADAGRDRAGARHPVRQVRRRLRDHHADFSGQLRAVHDQGQQLAYRHPARRQ
jgi:hypothetical protein